MAKRVFTFIFLALVLFSFLAWRYTDYLCKVNGASWSEISIGGFLCGYKLNDIEKYIPLNDLLDRKLKDEILKECLKKHEGSEYWCDPRYERPKELPTEGQT